jgi:hypothetical protein
MKGRRRTESSLKVWKPSYFSKDLVIQNVSKPLVAKLGGGLGEKQYFSFVRSL